MMISRIFPAFLPLHSKFLGLFILAAVVAAAGGCGEEATYSDMHLGQIEYDCQQTAPCDPVFNIRPDSVAKCIRETSMKLDSLSDAYRAMYETRFSRCAATNGCTYFACAQDTMLFSIVKEPLLRNECLQASACKTLQAQQLAPNEDQACFQALAQKLDFAPIPEKTAFEQHATRCAAQTGCAYFQCQ